MMALDQGVKKKFPKREIKILTIDIEICYYFMAV
jgi:hypothetical protein